MKAVLLERFGGARHLRRAQYPDPSPGPGEALLRVRACGLNHLDLWVRDGIPAYRIRLPHILGCDICGEVVSGDLDGSGLRPGQRVVVSPGRGCLRCEACLDGLDNRCRRYGIIGADGGPGGYAELVCVPSRNVFPAPERLSDEEAASFPLTFLTSWHMLMTLGRLQAGQTVLVLGAGSGVGVAAVQIASLAGAKVIAASTSSDKLAKARALGAHETLQSPPEDLRRKILSMTGSRGVDIVFEHIGPAVFEKALQCLKPGGALITCGATSGPNVELDLRYVFSRELRILGAKTGTPAEFLRLLGLLAEGALRPVLDRTFPLELAAQAQDYLAEKRQFGKVVLRV